MISKLAAYIAALTVIVGSVIGVESRYALASDLKGKADAAAVNQFQVLIMEDKLDELEFEKFALAQIPVEDLTPSQQFKLQRIGSRIEKVKRKLQFTN